LNKKGRLLNERKGTQRIVKKRRIYGSFLLAISAATSSKVAAKPLMCLVYE